MQLQHYPLLLYTPYKVGSSTFASYLQWVLNYRQIWHQNLHRVDLDTVDRWFLRGHRDPLKPVFDNPDAQFRTWVTLIRDPLHIYPSAYFQDIDNDNYEYYFGTREEVAIAGTAWLQSHFLDFNWDEFPQTSYDFNFEQIRYWTGIDLWQQPFDKQSGFSVYNATERNLRVVVLRTDKLSDFKTMEKLFIDLGWIDGIAFGAGFENNAHLLKINNGLAKWYAYHYRQFIRDLPTSYFERYRSTQQRIKNKFFA